MQYTTKSVLLNRLLHGALLYALSGCARGPLPCAGASACPVTQECLANRCAALETSPVRETTRRVVVAPIALAVASEHDSPNLAASVSLGSRQRGPAALYVRFDPKAYAARVEAAFLLLDPGVHSRFSQDVELQVGRAESAWRGTALSWSDQPGFGSPVARGIARTAPPSPIRIDVTELVRFVAEHPASDYGFVVRARERHAYGVSIATGTASGSAPRLDVYLTK
jgi:hypothetical protein